MINYIKSTEKDMDMLIESRMEMLKVVNNLPDNYNSMMTL
jgi:hypothetical protein